jgi:hypothetical protein
MEFREVGEIGEIREVREVRELSTADHNNKGGKRFLLLPSI